MDSDKIIEALKRLGVRHERIAEAIGRDRSAATKMLSGARAVKVGEVAALLELVAVAERELGEAPLETSSRDYIAIDILPSFAGMGGGGNGEGVPDRGLVPRRLVESDLRGRASDFLLIDVRGDSMEPDFQHGDQLLIDKRDRDPRQPGAFALFDGDGYVIKLVERSPQRPGWYRIFSANNRYSPYEIEEAAHTILGRPVWFARRL